MQNFEIRRWRETVTVATASCVRAYENLDLHSSLVFNGDWIPAIADQKLEKPRRFVVKTIYGGKLQINRKHLLKTNESYNDLEEIEDDPSDAEPDAQSVEEEAEHSTQEENELLVDEHSDKVW